MKATIAFLLAALGGGLIAGGGAENPAAASRTLNHPKLAAQFKPFVLENETRAKAPTNELPADFKAFFAAAAAGDWPAVSNRFKEFCNHAEQYEHSGKTDERLRGPAWEAVKEIWGAFDGFFVGDAKYSAAFGQAIINSIPPGSIYFGGTDPGRFIVSALCKSQAKGDPFFTLSQNPLGDQYYLEYLRTIYGGKIHLPTAADQQTGFEQYVADMQKRQTENRLKPGEILKVDNGEVRISGETSVMEINGLLAKIIFDRNPSREFFIEESDPLEWTYPHLEPHGLIFKINRQPLAKLSEAVVKRDHDYWVKTVQPMIGGWLHPNTPVEKIASFANKVFLQRDYSGFDGDLRFVQNDYSSRIFSWERSNIADLYVWRMNHAASTEEKNCMADEADFAFQQALALCPFNSEAAKSYIAFLKGSNRDADAARVDGMAKQFPKKKGK